jgi:hypothetical protein
VVAVAVVVVVLIILDQVQQTPLDLKMAKDT